MAAESNIGRLGLTADFCSRVSALVCGVIVTVAFVASVFTPSMVIADENFNSDGYRQNNYRTPTPDSVPGGTVLNVQQLKDLIATEQPVLIDVLTAGEASPDPFDGSWEIDEPHEHIPGSAWLPNVGRGYLDDMLEKFFRIELTRLTDRNKDRPVVFYCVRDCWMGWNATRRASRWGYSRVFWYPSGVEGWAEAREPVQVAKPVAVPVAE